MSIKYYDLDKKDQRDTYMKKGNDMKKRHYSSMYNNTPDENLQNESASIEEVDKSFEAVKEEKVSNLPLSPNTKGEIIRVQNLRLRKEPSENSEVIELVPCTNILEIVGRPNADWFEVNTIIFGSNKHGYVMSKFVRDYVEAEV